MKSKNVEMQGHLRVVSDKALDLVLKDYEVLMNLYTHSESAIQSLFNFYLTVLSAIIAGLIFTFQVQASDVEIVAGLLIFAIAVGVFYQSGIVAKYAEQTIYANALNDVRSLLYNLLAEENIPAFRLPFRSPMTTQMTSTIDRWEKKMWWLFPVGTHQLFIAFINSVCLALLIWVIFISSDLVISRLWQGILISFLVFGLGIVANDSYAVIKLNREIKKNREIIPHQVPNDRNTVSDEREASQINNTLEPDSKVADSSSAVVVGDEPG